jgi:hypothetical protein
MSGGYSCTLSSTNEKRSHGLQLDFPLCQPHPRPYLSYFRLWTRNFSGLTRIIVASMSSPQASPPHLGCAERHEATGPAWTVF